MTLITASRLRRRGMALLMAVLMISIVASALAALTLSFSTNAKRTMRQAQDAQLRQVLLAGQIAVSATIGKIDKGEVVLPADLRASGMSVRYEAIAGGSADEVQVRVTAQIAGARTMIQTLRFARAGDHFELRAAEL